MASLIISRQARDGTAFVLRDLSVTAGHVVAAGYAETFENLYERLKCFPDSGAPRPAVSVFARIGVISPHVVIYEFDPASGGPVAIQRTVQGRRKIAGRVLVRDAPSTAP